MRYAQASDVAIRRAGAASAGLNVPLFAAIALIQADALVHILTVREHFAEWWGYGAFFVVVAVVQIAYSLALARRPSQPLVLAGILGTLALLGLYALTRAIGIPFFGPHAWHRESVGMLDVLSKALEAASILPLAATSRWRSATGQPSAPATRNEQMAPGGSPRFGRRSLVTLLIGSAVVMVLLVIGYRFGTGLDFGSWGGTVSASDNAACARRSCDVHFTATLAGRAYAERLGIWDEISPRLTTSEAFVLTATAHAGEVKGLTMDDRVFLRQDGVLYPAAGRPVAVTTHHNTYLVFFPRFDMNGRPLLGRNEGQFELVVKDPAGGEPRLLTFNYPLVDAAGPGLPLPQVLMTLGAAMAALLFACTPCLVGSLAVGSMTTGAAVSFDRRAVRSQVRRRIVRQTLVYLGAVVIAYLAVAIAVNLLKLKAEALRPIEFTGGVALVVVGFSLLRAWRPLGIAAQRSVAALRRAVTRRAPKEDPNSVRFDDRSASAMGASLAMVCSVAGAPTLSTAILLPLLVYAGLSHPLWAIAILAIYLLICAVPFFFVAVGWGEFLVNASMRWRTAVLVTSGLVLVALGLLLVLSPAAVANTISVPARLALGPFRWLG